MNVHFAEFVNRDAESIRKSETSIHHIWFEIEVKYEELLSLSRHIGNADAVVIKRQKSSVV